MLLKFCKKKTEEVPKDALGSVTRIDEDGNALIDFEGIDYEQWVSKVRFNEVLVCNTALMLACENGNVHGQVK